MQIKIHAQHFELTEDHKSVIENKVEKVIHLAHRLSDPSSEIRVDLIHENFKSAHEAFTCHLTLFVPHDKLRSESHASSPETSVDLAIEKIKAQIEHYKAKEHHMGDRHP